MMVRYSAAPFLSAFAYTYLRLTIIPVHILLGIFCARLSYAGNAWIGVGRGNGMVDSQVKIHLYIFFSFVV
jgi:hypothetical protein